MDATPKPKVTLPADWSARFHAQHGDRIAAIVARLGSIPVTEPKNA